MCFPFVEEKEREGDQVRTAAGTKLFTTLRRK